MGRLSIERASKSLENFGRGYGELVQYPPANYGTEI